MPNLTPIPGLPISLCFGKSVTLISTATKPLEKDSTACSLPCHLVRPPTVSSTILDDAYVSVAMFCYEENKTLTIAHKRIADCPQDSFQECLISYYGSDRPTKASWSTGDPPFGLPQQPKETPDLQA